MTILKKIVRKFDRSVALTIWEICIFLQISPLSFRPPVNTMDNTVSTLSSPTLLAPDHIDGQIPDACLLEEFVSCQDEAAFTELVRRHGGLVRGVCRRILLDPAAADDAFQHTFFSLAQHASLLLRSVAPSASLGSWLYRVAVNASLQQKRKARSRRRTETQFAEQRPAAQSPSEPWNEVLPALDEEISALPGQYRSAVVKCHLEGKTQQDAAKELGITYATLRRRLKEARGMLRTRLSERGFAHNGFLMLPMLGYLADTEAVSAQTAVSVTQTVVATSSAQATTAGSVAVSSGGSLALGTKLLAANPLFKSALAGALFLGMAGTWWMVRSQSTVPDVPASPTLTEADSTATEEPTTPPEKPAERDQFLEEHFGYVFHNGQVASPEFQNAVKALDDSKGHQAKAAEADPLKLPEANKALGILKDVRLEAPLPKSADLLSQQDPSVLSEPVTPWDPGVRQEREIARTNARSKSHTRPAAGREGHGFSERRARTPVAIQRWSRPCRPPPNS